MRKIIAAIFFVLSISSVARAQPNPNAAPPPAPYVYDQKPMGGMPELIPAGEAQTIVDEFRTNYPRLGSPRLMIYVNRELVDEKSGLKLAGRTEKVVTSDKSGQTNAASAQTVVNNRYQADGAPSPTVMDRQTIRSLEQLMGRPLRSAGVTLTDQRTAQQLGGSFAAEALTTDTEAGRKAREAANKFADVVVEVLISSNRITLPGISSDRTYIIPQIQMTAIRVKDAKIIGQASSADVIAKAGGPGVVARNFSVDAITEVTTLALMDDILQETK